MPDLFQISAYLLVSLKAVYIYGIFLPNLENFTGEICVGIAYSVILLIVGYFALKLTIDDPTEFATVKTKYYKNVR